MAEKLQRELSNRHIQLIAIGGAIGTGLFLGAGQTIALTGPSILLTYIIIGFMLFMFMRGLGEIIIQNTEFKSFADVTNTYMGLLQDLLPDGHTGSVGLLQVWLK
ncbi:amino acid permease family protein [Staphylococcus aureus]|nr:amino acid permease family protein [Staphylococcus aureus]